MNSFLLSSPLIAVNTSNLSTRINRVDINHAIEDEDEYLAAWVDWVKTKIQVRRKKRTVTYLDKKVAELKVKRPELADILDELQGQDYSQSLIGGDWIPDTKNYFKEMDRIEANIGRYPVGFRHYENW